VVADLRPVVLDSTGLIVALRQHADLVTSRSTNRLRVTVTGNSPSDLPAAVEVAAYRIAMEALTNTVRHAGAHRCTVSVAHGHGLHLTVQDDGAAFRHRRPAPD